MKEPLTSTERSRRYRANNPGADKAYRTAEIEAAKWVRKQFPEVWARLLREDKATSRVSPPTEKLRNA